MKVLANNRELHVVPCSGVVSGPVAADAAAAHKAGSGKDKSSFSSRLLHSTMKHWNLSPIHIILSNILKSRAGFRPAVEWVHVEMLVTLVLGGHANGFVAQTLSRWQPGSLCNYMSIIAAIKQNMHRYLADKADRPIRLHRTPTILPQACWSQSWQAHSYP